MIFPRATHLFIVDFTKIYRHLLKIIFVIDMSGDCYVGGSYRGLLSLVRHSYNDTPIGIFWIIVAAVFHLRTLQLTGYFGKEEKSAKFGLGSNQLLIGAVLVDILQLIRYNTHSILEFVVKIISILFLKKRCQKHFLSG